VRASESALLRQLSHLGPDVGKAALEHLQLIDECLGVLPGEPGELALTQQSYLDDLSNWYIRRSHRRFRNGDAMALQALWTCLVQVLRVTSPVVRFLTEHLWAALVRDVCKDATSRCSSPGGPRSARSTKS
jgi:hypothetical protein